MILGILIGFLVPPGWALFWRYVGRRLHVPRWENFLFQWMYQAVVLAILWLAFWYWPNDAGAWASFAVAAIIRFWKSGKRRRATQQLGAKTRALRDSLVRRARETAIPRPILAPGGVT